MYVPDFYEHEFLAVRLPAAESWRIRPDVHRIPANAARRELQSQAVKAEIEERVKAMEGKME
jgi:hypothetical protein